MRPAAADDEPLLRAVFAQSSREALLAGGLAEREVELLLESQHRAWVAQLRSEYPDAGHGVVEVDGVPVGRIVVDRRPGEIRVVDVTLLAASRGLGIGSDVLRLLQAEAGASGQLLGLRVPRGGAAERLCTRLGFREAVADETHVEMAWEAGVDSLAPGAHPLDKGAAA